MAKKKHKKKLSARTADRHTLYEESVQAPASDAHFFSRYYKKYTGEPLRTFREDFCGTAVLSCEFVRLHRKNHAIGVDFNSPTLDWALNNNVMTLKPSQRERIQLILNNVLDVHEPLVDLIAALNFSYSVFKTRSKLEQYIKTSHRALKRGGLLALDAWGGGQAQFLMKEKRRLKNFTYIWDQAEFDPITHEIICKIHFEFKDGTRLKNAFVYDWRLWTLPELRELMEEAGFKDIHVLWEGTDRKTGEGNGIFRRVKRGGDEEAWLAYVIGKKS